MSGRVAARSQHFVLHVAAGKPNDAPTTENGQMPAFGTILPKRWAKSAVRRNLIRRLYFEQVKTISINASANARMVVLRLNKSFDAKVFGSASSPALKCELKAQLRQLTQVLA